MALASARRKLSLILHSSYRKASPICYSHLPYANKTFERGAWMRQLLGLQPRDRLALSLEADGLIDASAACFVPITVALELGTQRGMRSADQF